MPQARILTAWFATCLLNGCLYPEYIETDTFDREKRVQSGGNASTGGAADTRDTTNSDAPLAGGAGTAGNAGDNGGGEGGASGTALPPTRGGSSSTRATVTSPNGGIGTQPNDGGRGGTDAGAAGNTVDHGTRGDVAGSGAILSSCGNRKREGTEACDDGNRIDGDGCSSDCRSTEICGNGVLDRTKGEECDLGACTASTSTPTTCNHDSGNCTSECRFAKCGDGKQRFIVAADGGAPEACDLGSANVSPEKAYGEGVCTTACEAAPRCGDGKIDQTFGESCDDNNSTSGDGCSATCKNGQNRPCVSSTDCAEGLVCDLSPGENRCEKERSCGNGKLDKAEKEACDDGNTADADGCSGQCLLEPGSLTECSTSAQCATGSCLPSLDGSSSVLTPTRRCLIRNGDGPCTTDVQCEGGVCLVGTCAASTT